MLSRFETMKYSKNSLKEKERKIFKEKFSEMLDRSGNFSSGYIQEFDFAYKNHCEIFNPHCASTRWNACIHKAVGLSEFLFVYYRFYFGEGSLLDAKGVKQLL